VDVHGKLAALRQAVEQARSMPMSASAVVNRGELLELLDDLRTEIDSALAESQHVLSDKEAAIMEGRREAEQIIEEGRRERDRLVGDTDIFRVGQRQADQLLEKARVEADELRKETDEYVDGKLANFEITLERTMEAVKRGRERLAGRSALDSLADDEIGDLKLPGHLDG
jgi:cell division septum initiation protein DivIVA